MGAASDAGSRESCALARQLISAATDDELGHDERGRLDAHVAGCADCRRHVDDVASLTRTIRLRSAESEREFVALVMARSRPARLGRGRWLRPALAWCGLVIAVLSLRPLLLGEIDDVPTHIARHIGASSLALAVGLLYAAWKPHRAFGLLPLVVALMATTMVSTMLDLIDGTQSVAAEAVHIIEMIGLVLLWMAAGSPGWERSRDFVRSFSRSERAARPTS